ncbi:hypothetical protein [Ktedonobacter robiniae]|uniref:hypothetical protein n=1 Tax=Ktedonobacter robiniae TaxID=2778365 RepID=UPI001916A23B|nr:hypothetical protein [Ktedonobacter robiniae]
MRVRLGKIVGVWKHLHHCWNVVVLIWVSGIIGWLISVLATWSITKNKGWDVSDTPLSWAFDHLAITLPVVGVFLAFTILVRLASIQVAKESKATAIQPAHHSPELNSQDRTRLHQYLTQWYKEFLGNRSS